MKRKCVGSNSMNGPEPPLFLFELPKLFFEIASVFKEIMLSLQFQRQIQSYAREENQRELVKLIRRVRKECPGKTIWMYSGNTYEEMLEGGRRHIEVTDEILDSIDILVDGRFEEELKDISLNFRGSSNQRIIDMKKTRSTGQVVLDPLND